MSDVEQDPTVVIRQSNYDRAQAALALVRELGIEGARRVKVAEFDALPSRRRWSGTNGADLAGPNGTFLLALPEPPPVLPKEPGAIIRVNRWSPAAAEYAGRTLAPGMIAVRTALTSDDMGRSDSWVVPEVVWPDVYGSVSIVVPDNAWMVEWVPLVTRSVGSPYLEDVDKLLDTLTRIAAPAGRNEFVVPGMLQTAEMARHALDVYEQETGREVSR